MDGATLQLQTHVVYLGLPIGKSMLKTEQLLIIYLQDLVTFMYSLIVANERKFDWQVLAQLHNKEVPDNGTTENSNYKGYN